MKKKLYLPLSELASLPGSDRLNTIFGDFHLFDGTLTYTDYNGNIKTYVDFDMDSSELLAYWLEFYGEKRAAIPFKGNLAMSASEIRTEVEDICSHLAVRASMWYSANKDRYFKLLQTLDYDYDPISNYDMVEASGDAMKRAIEEIKDEYVSGNKTSSSNIVKDRTDSFTTSYESSSDGDARLAARQESSGLNSSGVATAPVLTETDSTNRKKTLGFGNDTVSFTADGNYIGTPTADEAKVHQLTRKGNIGVTTSQQMIESERELQKFSIINMFFEEINHILLLEAWF